MHPPTFADLGVPPSLLHVLEREGFTEPFEVQAATIADQLAGRDVCGRAPTGSGKTLAFGIPLVARVGKAQPKRPTGLVLVPTRELADQITRELLPLARAGKRWLLAVYGGVGYGGQRQALRKGVDVLVACPGRLADLVGQGDVSLSDVRHVVIDEADRMADMGFLPEVKRLLDQTHSDRQTVLFSATLDSDVAVLTERYQRDPVRVEVGDAEPDVHAMTHHFWRVSHHDRVATGAAVVKASGPTIVFTRTRHGADRVARQLAKHGLRTEAIHGSRSQGQRNRALSAFSSGKAHALVATDVAARGIHVEDVACVLHFDPPNDHKTYLHRSGRTARAGASGLVVSFIQDAQVKDTTKMQRTLGLAEGVNDHDMSLLDTGVRHRVAVRPDGDRDSEQPSRGRSRPPKSQRGPKRTSTGGEKRRPQREDDRGRKTGKRAGGSGRPPHRGTAAKSSARSRSGRRDQQHAGRGNARRRSR